MAHNHAASHQRACISALTKPIRLEPNGPRGQAYDQAAATAGADIGDGEDEC